ncbi:methyltransferase-like protein 22 isoform X3 [Acipenser oxyrinchus oxyrinchus]|uniref:Methyltransferase-like protein 22 isoform X3 n=1 Tax=Acipenser oxyrinchus oxyrinchus TaxID=40147 RepID=A0AAD8G0E8_ACIOX|nr:methyltransferase-like protein 22 isoform X3 [Acipenser oxyrinchus oxyrinchus]
MDAITFRSDTVLSDIHLLQANTRHLMVRLNAVGQPVFVSQFKEEEEEEEEEGEDGRPQSRGLEPLLDEDGDLDVVRRPRGGDAPGRDRIYPIILSKGEEAASDGDELEESDRGVIRIEHTMATPLEDVGKQVWRGAFLMADFILSHRDQFQDCTVLELGAGTGVTSIVMATVAKRVYCTDVGQDLLSMCERNVALNKHILESADGDVKVCELDWMRDDFCTDPEVEFSWTEDEVADLHDNTTVLIAADVCYDDDLTDGLFRTLYRIMSNLRHPCTLYFSIEKRLNFTLQHMDVSCEAYDHFRACLSDLKNITDGKTIFTVEPVQLCFPQFLIYERIKQLELWKITSSHPDQMKATPAM